MSRPAGAGAGTGGVDTSRMPSLALAWPVSCNCSYATWRWQVPKVSVSPVSQGCVRQPQRKRWDAAWGASETSGDQHLGRGIELPACLKSGSIWSTSPTCVWPHLPKEQKEGPALAGGTAPRLAGTHGRIALADGPNIRLGRQDEVQVVSFCDEPEPQSATAV